MPFSAIDIQPASEYGHSMVSQDSNAMLSGKNQRIMFNIPGLRAADVQALVDRVKTLEAELARRPASSDDTDVVALQAELAQTSQELDRLRIDYDALVTDLQNIEFELDASAASVETLTVQLDKTEQELADVKGELVNSQHAGEALRERVEKLERGRREDVSRRSKEYMSRVSDTKSLREELDEAHESLASVRADWRSRRRRTEDVSALQVERDATRAQLLDREGEVAAMVGVILDLKAQISGERPAPGRSTSKMYLRDLSIVSEEDETSLWKVSALERDVSDLRVS
ncbi:hypothetical protein BKA62DRAFT_488861 [Auriculariales sp. MPI-PUGE-AT-0066]|nr:hypothetical protein BKA62DRAFT_488861 [Auriculariales sp. MPI-PUGE-AT-0066]